MDDMSGSSPIESNAKSEPDADSDSVRPAMGNFTKLSWFMGKYNEMNIFRRYSFLQAQNLVGLQMELAHLEDQLDMIRDDKQRLDAEDPEKALVLDESQYWRALCDNSESEEYQKILEIRSKLKEYNDALIQYHDVCKLNTPTKHDLGALRQWLWRPEGGDCFLRGVEGDAWDSERTSKQDLVTMCDAHHDRTLFGSFLADNVTSIRERVCRLWSRPKHLDPENAGLSHYDDSKINAIAHFLGTLIASMLPAMSIFVLYFVNSMLDRLCIILAFSALFSFTLAIFTRAKGVEIFAATAAFGSVQVVFVGTTGGPPIVPGM